MEGIFSSSNDVNAHSVLDASDGDCQFEEKLDNVLYQHDLSAKQPHSNLTEENPAALLRSLPDAHGPGNIRDTGTSVAISGADNSTDLVTSVKTTCSSGGIVLNIAETGLPSHIGDWPGVTTATSTTAVQASVASVPANPQLSASSSSQALLETQASASEEPLPSTVGDPSLISQSTPGVRPTFKQWTYQEQFKQLYEMSSEPERKKFLDELFDFMQARGTPVSRIPIMAKVTLDLYQLFIEVCDRGGLLEVINKKQWREVANRLGIPTTITSAAFTLRTQYTRFLYPYECETKKFSTLSDLENLIESTKRDTRHNSTSSTPDTPNASRALGYDAASSYKSGLPLNPAHEPAAKRSTHQSGMPAMASFCGMRIQQASLDASGNIMELPADGSAITQDHATNALVVSMDINGQQYNGILYARQLSLPIASSTIASGNMMGVAGHSCLPSADPTGHAVTNQALSCTPHSQEHAGSNPQTSSIDSIENRVFFPSLAVNAAHMPSTADISAPFESAHDNSTDISTQ